MYPACMRLVCVCFILDSLHCTCSIFLLISPVCFLPQRGTVGMVESCPQNEFWFSVPGLVKDGIAYVPSLRERFAVWFALPCMCAYLSVAHRPPLSVLTIAHSFTTAKVKGLINKGSGGTTGDGYDEL